jgi:hypothetical protein
MRSDALQCSQVSGLGLLLLLLLLLLQVHYGWLRHPPLLLHVLFSSMHTIQRLLLLSLWVRRLL